MRGFKNSFIKKLVIYGLDIRILIRRFVSIKGFKIWLSLSELGGKNDRETLNTRLKRKLSQVKVRVTGRGLIGKRLVKVLGDQTIYTGLSRTGE